MHFIISYKVASFLLLIPEHTDTRVHTHFWVLRCRPGLGRGEVSKVCLKYVTNHFILSCFVTWFALIWHAVIWYCDMYILSDTWYYIRLHEIFNHIISFHIMSTDVKKRCTYWNVWLSDISIVAPIKNPQTNNQLTTKSYQPDNQQTNKPSNQSTHWQTNPPTN